MTAPNIIATVTGSPSTSLPVIKWTSSGVLTWSADNEGTGGGGGSSTIIGLTDTPLEPLELSGRFLLLPLG